MKLKSLIDEKFGLPGNSGRDFGERFMRDFITPGNFAELWTAFEATYPELKPQLQTTFEKTNDLLRYIKPGKGDEAYRVSQMPDVVAQELNALLDNALETLEFVSSQEEQPSKEMVIPVIKDFDNIFEDMLNLFTSNTKFDEPLEPYKQSNIGFKSSVKELSFKDMQHLNKENQEEDLYDLLKSKRHDINVEFGPRTYSMLQQQMMLGNEGYVRDWMEKNSFIEQQDDWPPKDNALGEKIREVIKKEIKSLKDSH